MHRGKLDSMRGQSVQNNAVCRVRVRRSRLSRLAHCFSFALASCSSTALARTALPSTRVSGPSRDGSVQSHCAPGSPTAAFISRTLATAKPDRLQRSERRGSAHASAMRERRCRPLGLRDLAVSLLACSAGCSARGANRLQNAASVRHDARARSAPLVVQRGVCSAMTAAGRAARTARAQLRRNTQHPQPAHFRVPRDRTLRARRAPATLRNVIEPRVRAFVALVPLNGVAPRQWCRSRYRSGARDTARCRATPCHAHSYMTQLYLPAHV